MQYENIYHLQVDCWWFKAHFLVLQNILILIEVIFYFLCLIQRIVVRNLTYHLYFEILKWTHPDCVSVCVCAHACVPPLLFCDLLRSQGRDDVAPALPFSPVISVVLWTATSAHTVATVGSHSVPLNPPEVIYIPLALRSHSCFCKLLKTKLTLGFPEEPLD